MKRVISLEDLRGLFTKPYGEVAQAIAALSKLPKLDPKINPTFVKESDKKNDTKQ